MEERPENRVERVAQRPRIKAAEKSKEYACVNSSIYDLEYHDAQEMITKEWKYHIRVVLYPSVEDAEYSDHIGMSLFSDEFGVTVDVDYELSVAAAESAAPLARRTFSKRLTKKFLAPFVSRVTFRFFSSSLSFQMCAIAPRSYAGLKFGTGKLHFSTNLPLPP